MIVTYAMQEHPETLNKSAMFLAGPTPRSADVPSWRPQAIRILEDLGYDGVVFIPEPEDQGWHHEYIGQVEWELEGLERSDTIVFWVPRDLETMPAFTTNIEFGSWVRSGKIVLGSPYGAPKMKYLHYLYEKYNGRKHSETLRETLVAAVEHAKNKEFVKKTR